MLTRWKSECLLWSKVFGHVGLWKHSLCFVEDLRSLDEILSK